MGRKITILVFFFVNGIYAISVAQSSYFQSKFNEIESHLMILNTDEAIQKVDSLIEVSDGGLEKIKVHSLYSMIYQSIGNFDLALNYAFKADRLSSLMGLGEYQTKIALKIASIYRELGIYQEAIKYIDRAKLNLRIVRDSTRIKELNMLILQEESFLQILSKNYNDVIDNLYPHIDENKTIYKKTPESLLTRIRSNFILAECFNEIGRFSESVIRSRMALDDLSDNEYLIKPFIFQSIAKSYIKLGKMDSSKRYLNEIIPYIERSNNIELKRRFYLLEADYFKHVKNESLAYRYIESYSKIEEQKKTIIQSMVNRMIKSIRDRETQT